MFITKAHSALASARPAATSIATRKLKGGKVFFVDVFYELNCVTEGETALVVASRRKAKKVISYIRTRSLEFHGSTIQAARQRDLFLTGCTVNRSARPPELGAALNLQAR